MSAQFQCSHACPFAQVDVLQVQVDVHKYRQEGDKYLKQIQMAISIVGAVVVGLAVLGAIIVLLRVRDGQALGATAGKRALCISICSAFATVQRPVRSLSLAPART